MFRPVRVILSTVTTFETLRTRMAYAVKYPSCGLQTDTAFRGQDEGLSAFEAHDLANLRRCAIQEAASVLRAVCAESSHFKDAILFCLRSDWTATNNRSNEFAVFLCTEAESVSNYRRMVSVDFANKSIRFRQRSRNGFQHLSVSKEVMYIIPKLTSVYSGHR